MRIKHAPQVNNPQIKYRITGEIITATIDGITDTFDFTRLPEGHMVLHDDEGQPTTETILPVNPIISARRDANGILWVVLLNWIPADETRHEVLFPDWQEVA